MRLFIKRVEGKGVNSGVSICHNEWKASRFVSSTLVFNTAQPICETFHARKLCVSSLSNRASLRQVISRSIVQVCGTIPSWL